MSLTDKVERLLGYGAASEWGERISAEIAFLKSISDAREGCIDAQIEETADALLLEINKAGGVITRDAAMHAENALLSLSPMAKSYRVHCVSHAHIDMNWQWGFQETVAVTADTFRTVLDLMREYEDFTFAQSQASTYRMIEEFTPDLLEEIKQRVKEGRWEVSASTWVETDKNMPSGESLARHILYTKRYLSKLLDIPPESLTLDFEPDTFGHAASIPEICTQGGVKYYYHWRGYDGPDFAYRWRSPSGAELLSWHESECYNYTVSPQMFRPVPIRCARYGLDCYLSLYGVGDPGGGPTRRDVERLIEYAKWPLMPSLFFSTYGAFFKDLERFRESLPIRTGEQNFVFTGCYTSQSRIKMANRLAEARMYDSELLSAEANVLLCGRKYNESYGRAWEQILFNQFHDILPGSGVIDTREYALGEFQRAMAAIQTNANSSLRLLAEGIDTSALGEVAYDGNISEGAGVGYLTGARSKHNGRYGMPSAERGAGKKRIFHLFNTTQYDYDGVGEVTVWDWQYDGNRAVFRDATGNPAESVLLNSGKHYWGHEYMRFGVRVRVPAFGYATYTLDEAERGLYVPSKRRDPLTDLYHDGEIVLENDKLRASFDRMTMQLVSLVELSSGRELIAKPAGTFRLIDESTVHHMTSWRVGEYMRTEDLNVTQKVCVTEAVTKGLLKQISYELSFGHGSKLSVTVSLRDGSTVLDYDVAVDFLEVGDKTVVPQLNFTLPLGYAAERYRYDIPFGTIERPALAHDVPGTSYAVALPTEGGAAPALMLVSDTKYGFRGAKDTLSLSLIRASRDPDPYPELARHNFHVGVAVLGDTAHETIDRTARVYLHPLSMCSARVGKGAGTLPTVGSLMTLSGEVSVSAVKTAEDGDGLVIRLYDRAGGGSPFTLLLCKTVREAFACDLNETPRRALSVDGNAVIGTVLPSGVATVLVRF